MNFNQNESYESETYFGGKMAKNKLKMNVFYANLLQNTPNKGKIQLFLDSREGELGGKN